jgi:signal transduction histidine kinase
MWIIALSGASARRAGSAPSGQSSLVSLLLARSGAEASAPHEVMELSAVVRGELARARGVTVSSDVAPGLLVVGSPDSFARSLRNLLDNAERHGVAAVDRERIFDRFVRLDESRTRDDGGAGLGLAISRHLLAQHGASIRAGGPCDETNGAVFVIEVPLAPVAGR